MKKVIKTEQQSLVSLSGDQLAALAGCLNEVLHNSSVDEQDCHSRIGVALSELKQLHQDLISVINTKPDDDSEVFEAWVDQEAVQLRAVSVFGDPADLSIDEIRDKLRPLFEDGSA